MPFNGQEIVCQNTTEASLSSEELFIVAPQISTSVSYK